MENISSNQFSFKKNTQIPHQSQQQIVLTTKCPQNHDSHSVCSNKNCKSNAFICKNKTCSCKINHHLCFITETQTILKNFASKIISAQTLKEFIDEHFNKLIDQISDFRDELFHEILTNFQPYGLNENQKKVYRSIELGKTEQITGRDIWKACFDTFDQQIPNLDQLKQSIGLNFQQLEVSTQIVLYQIRSIIKDVGQIKCRTDNDSVITFSNSKNEMLLRAPVKKGYKIPKCSENENNKVIITQNAMKLLESNAQKIEKP